MSLLKHFSLRSQPQRVETNEKPEKARPASLTLRLTADERERLERDSAGMSLSGYVRQQLFGDAAKPRRTRGKFPVKDHEALARVLSRLGRSELAMAVGGLLLAVEAKRLHLDNEQAKLLRSIENDLLFVRTNLIKALGLYPLGLYPKDPP